MPYYAYLLEITQRGGESTSYHAGHTGHVTTPISTLARSIAKRQQGKGTTVELVYAEAYTSEAAAARRYKEIKALSRRAKKRLVMSGCDVLI
ncbi:MAG: hypothetical protein Q6373_024470 [Candidatus Sigynarchaeota archaeon]